MFAEKNLQRFSQLLGTGGVGATPPRRGFTPAPRIQTARKVLYYKPKNNLKAWMNGGVFWGL